MNKDNDYYWQELLHIFLSQKNKENMELFLTTLLTISEKTELIKRYRIIKELLENTKTQREMASDLQVSIANVTRGSNLLKIGNNSDLKKIFKIKR